LVGAFMLTISLRPHRWPSHDTLFTGGRGRGILRSGPVRFSRKSRLRILNIPPIGPGICGFHGVLLLRPPV